MQLKQEKDIPRLVDLNLRLHLNEHSPERPVLLDVQIWIQVSGFLISHVVKRIGVIVDTTEEIDKLASDLIKYPGGLVSHEVE